MSRALRLRTPRARRRRSSATPAIRRRAASCASQPRHCAIACGNDTTVFMSASATPGRAHRLSDTGRSISRWISSSLSNASVSSVTDTEPSIMFSIGTTPPSASPRSTAAITSGTDAYGTRSPAGEVGLREQRLFGEGPGRARNTRSASVTMLNDGRDLTRSQCRGLAAARRRRAGATCRLGPARPVRGRVRAGRRTHRTRTAAPRPVSHRELARHLFVVDLAQTAFGVGHHHDRARFEQPLREHERAEHVVAHHPPGVPRARARRRTPGPARRCGSIRASMHVTIAMWRRGTADGIRPRAGTVRGSAMLAAVIAGHTSQEARPCGPQCSPKPEGRSRSRTSSPRRPAPATSSSSSAPAASATPTCR